mgnify:CR=1 FL=1
MRIIKEISSIVEDKNKMEQMIINKHSEKDEDGNPVQAKDEDGNPVGFTIKNNATVFDGRTSVFD